MHGTSTRDGGSGGESPRRAFSFFARIRAVGGSDSRSNDCGVRLANSEARKPVPIAIESHRHRIQHVPLPARETVTHTARLDGGQQPADFLVGQFSPFPSTVDSDVPALQMRERMHTDTTIAHQPIEERLHRHEVIVPRSAENDRSLATSRENFPRGRRHCRSTAGSGIRQESTARATSPLGNSRESDPGLSGSVKSPPDDRPAAFPSSTIGHRPTPARRLASEQYWADLPASAPTRQPVNRVPRERQPASSAFGRVPWLLTCRPACSTRSVVPTHAGVNRAAMSVRPPARFATAVPEISSTLRQRFGDAS